MGGSAFGFSHESWNPPIVSYTFDIPQNDVRNYLGLYVGLIMASASQKVKDLGQCWGCFGRSRHPSHAGPCCRHTIHGVMLGTVWEVCSTSPCKLRRALIRTGLSSLCTSDHLISGSTKQGTIMGRPYLLSG